MAIHQLLCIKMHAPWLNGWLTTRSPKEDTPKMPQFATPSACLGWPRSEGVLFSQHLKNILDKES